MRQRESSLQTLLDVSSPGGREGERHDEILEPGGQNVHYINEKLSQNLIDILHDMRDVAG